jgi:bifunctional DNA-binding transcriptional regulator/antitoxin component of YhaV-PrlF toxin-antitoxin module
MTAITIDTTGRLEIPLEIRQQLGITTAQSLSLEVVNGCIILQAVDERSPVTSVEIAEVPSKDSFLVAAGELIGCLDGLPPDLSHNKHYLEGLGER